MAKGIQPSPETLVIREIVAKWGVDHFAGRRGKDLEEEVRAEYKKVKGKALATQHDGKIGTEINRRRKALNLVKTRGSNSPRTWENIQSQIEALQQEKEQLLATRVAELERMAAEIGYSISKK